MYSKQNFTFPYLAALALLAIGLAGCGADPTRQAQADAITRASIQAAADAEAARQQRLLTEQARRLSQERTQAQVAVVLPVVVVVVSVTVSLAAVAVVVAYVLSIRSGMTSKTPTRYPVFLQPIGAGRYLLTDSMTGEHKLLDVRKDGGLSEFAIIDPVSMAKES